MQIAIIDSVSSLDSVIIAVGMAQHIEVMAFSIFVEALSMRLRLRSTKPVQLRKPSLEG